MLPIVLKGIMSSEDAQLAVELGVDAVWISNHGGRQLDTVLPTVSWPAPNPKISTKIFLFSFRLMCCQAWFKQWVESVKYS